MSSDKESEANHFAMCLLMPEQMVREHVNRWPLDLTDDDGLERLAKKFGVSRTLAAKRLVALELM